LTLYKNGKLYFYSYLAKHGVSFGEATEAFYDPDGLEDYDAEHWETERRFFIIGLSSRRLLYVIYAEQLGDTIRIISARKADQVEQQMYERTKNR